MRYMIASLFTASTLLASTQAFADDAATSPTVPPTNATLTPMPTQTALQPSQESTTLYEKHTPNKPLLLTGGAIFLGSYVTTAAITAANPHTLDKSLYLPIVGPWLTLAQAGDYGTGKTVLIAGSGVLQGVGAGLALASLFIPEKTAAATIQAGNVRMNVVPASYGAGSAGLGAIGTF